MLYSPGGIGCPFTTVCHSLVATNSGPLHADAAPSPSVAAAEDFASMGLLTSGVVVALPPEAAAALAHS